ncbi:ROK family transcriptional regulator [Streptomyces sp. NPDC088270]|uniref:ROK family transcriptional regulator n=1 Tax=Streptomyces sp. NPDC088270 TaxID=3160990 RepID=UPI0034215016
MNDRAALDLLVKLGPLSRTRIGDLTGLSKPTASQLVTRLEDAGLVVATGTAMGSPGPGARLYSINARAAYVIGMDVTSSRVRAAVADIAGRIIGEHELPIAGHLDQGAVPPVMAVVDGALKEAGLTRSEIHRIVMGMPALSGPSTGRLPYTSRSPGWFSSALMDELSAALPIPIECEKDVNLAALAEQRLGAAREHQDFVLLWNQEELGAAVVIGYQLHRGWTGRAGQVRFLPVPATPLVRQGANAEGAGSQQLAVPQMLAELARRLGIDDFDCGPYEEVAIKVIERATTVGDGLYPRLLEAFATGLAIVLATMTAILDPGLLVLSGAVFRSGGEQLRRLIESELTGLTPTHPRLVVGGVQQDPVLRGAVEYALATTRDEVFDTSL